MWDRLRGFIATQTITVRNTGTVITFKCAHCGVYAQHTKFSVSDMQPSLQIVSNILETLMGGISNMSPDHRSIMSMREDVEGVKQDLTKRAPRAFAVTTCLSCKKFSLWVKDDRVYPRKTSIEPPNEDMSDKIKELYLEAANILTDSPRGAAALLRLALQLLLKQLGQLGVNIYKDIRSLVDKGDLDPEIKRAMDAVRMIGNNAVHAVQPGVIDLHDKEEQVALMFDLLNRIAEKMLTLPKKLQRLMSSLHAHRPTARTAHLRIVRLDQLTQLSPRNEFIHLC